MVIKNYYLFSQIELSSHFLQDCVKNGVLTIREMESLRSKNRHSRSEPFLNLLVSVDRTSFNAFIRIFKASFPKLHAKLEEVQAAKLGEYTSFGCSTK